MKELVIAIGVCLTATVVVAGVYIVQSFLSRAPNAQARGDTFLSKVHIGATWVGLIAFVTFGIKGLLFWLPPSWDEAAVFIAFSGGLASVFLSQYLDQLPLQRSRLNTYAAISQWFEQRLRYGGPPSGVELVKLAKDVENRANTATEKHIAVAKYEIALALKSLEERIRLRGTSNNGVESRPVRISSLPR